MYHQSEYTFKYEFSTSVYGGQYQRNAEPHFHKNFETIIVKKGRCRCIVAGQEYIIRAGEAIMITPYQIHGFFTDEASEVRRVTFHEHLILSLAQFVDGRKPENPVFKPSPFVCDFFMSLMETSFGDDSGFYRRISPVHLRMQVKGGLYMLGGEFINQVSLIPTQNADALTMAVAQYISENFKKNISLGDVAREKGYNYQYLSRTFNKVIGMNFKKMLNQYRMECAYALLQDTDIPISQICFESGFQSIRSFNQVCLDTFGKSPKELRRID